MEIMTNDLALSQGNRLFDIREGIQLDLILKEEIFFQGLVVN